MSYNNRNIDTPSIKVKTQKLPENQADKEIKVVVTDDSLLSGISKKGLSKNRQVKVKHFPRGATKTISVETNNLIIRRPDCLIIHAGRKDLTKGINSLNYF